MSRKAHTFSTTGRLEPPANEILPMFEASRMLSKIRSEISFLDLAASHDQRRVLVKMTRRKASREILCDL